MEKKLFIICCIVFILCVFVIVFSWPEPDEYNDMKETEAENTICDLSSAVLPETLDDDRDICVDTPTREYGEIATYMLWEEDIISRILYPNGEAMHLTHSIEAWIEKIASYYRYEISQWSEGDNPSELTVEYSSYSINDNLVSVRMYGIFDDSSLAHPVDVIATFNTYVNQNEVLQLSDVITADGEQILQNMVAEQAGVKKEDIDGVFLQYWLLTHDGLEITLARGDYLPMSDGTRTFFFPYEELEGMLSIEITKETDADLPETPLDNHIAESISGQKSGEIGGSMLALTFDDGPSAYTDRLLDTLSEYGGHATFFVVGNMIEDRPELLVRMALEGHEIGGHSWSHRDLTKLNKEDIENQIIKTNNKIQEVSDVSVTLMRPPYGACNDRVKNVAADLNVSIINWSVDTLDWKYKNADTVYKSIMREAYDGAIILCHDLHKTTVDAMERVIPDLIDQGYQLVTVSQLMQTKGINMRPGNVYSKAQ